MKLKLLADVERVAAVMAEMYDALRCYEFYKSQSRCDGPRRAKPIYGQCDACAARDKYNALMEEANQ